MRRERVKPIIDKINPMISSGKKINPMSEHTNPPVAMPFLCGGGMCIPPPCCGCGGIPGIPGCGGGGNCCGIPGCGGGIAPPM